MVGCSSNKKVWWICNKNNKHSWETTINARQNCKNGCPYCAADILPMLKPRGVCQFPIENKYVEVTSYNKKNLAHVPGRYFSYLRKIVKKRQFVRDVLKAFFEFIQFVPSKEQIRLVRMNIA